MTIDSSGKWWVGSEATDCEAYLTSYNAGGWPVHETRLCRCPCGSLAFSLQADPNEGCARRICTACGAEHMICDSAEYWDDAEPMEWECVKCQCRSCNLAVGFSLYKQDTSPERDIRWISIANRCTACGTLGCFADWKVGYGPSHHLLDQA